MYVLLCACRVQVWSYFQGSVLSFHYLGLGDGTYAVRLGSQCLHQLSHLKGPSSVFDLLWTCWNCKSFCMLGASSESVLWKQLIFAQSIHKSEIWSTVLTVLLLCITVLQNTSTTLPCSFRDILHYKYLLLCVGKGWVGFLPLSHGYGWSNSGQ